MGFFERYKAVFIGVAVAAVTGGLIFAGVRYQRPSSVEIIPPAATATPAPMRIYVSGAVAQPEVYTLPAGAILQDALNAAGGPTADADLSRVNLAQILIDGEQIVIPQQGEAQSITEEGETPVITGPININTATLAELDTLPGVGPAIAQRIIDYRTENGPFSTIEDIQNVSGIGPSTFEEIKDLITVN